jgi:hypothetical protein
MDFILTHEELSGKPVIKPCKGIQIVDHRLWRGRQLTRLRYATDGPRKGRLTTGVTPRGQAQVAEGKLSHERSESTNEEYKHD